MAKKAGKTAKSHIGPHGRHSIDLNREFANRSEASKKKRMIAIAKTLGAIAIIILLAVIIAYGSSWFKQDSERSSAVALVNDEKITLEQLNTEYNRLTLEQKQVFSKIDYLNQTMIPTMLLLQEAEKSAIAATDKEVEDFINLFLDYSGMTKEDLQSQLDDSGMTYEQFYDLYKKRLVLVKLLNQTIGDPGVSEQEIKQFYDENKAAFLVGNETLELEEASEQIRSFLSSQKQQEGIEKYISMLMATAKIKLYPENMITSPSDMKGLAVGSGTGTNPAGTSFQDTGEEICYEDGKPIIRLYSTTSCPHCRWVKATFDSVAKEYEAKGAIAAYHWELDASDNTLTTEKEKEIPDSEIALLTKYNPNGGVPFYMFGCKYARIGNAYESQNDLDAEEGEFRAVIESLISST